MTTGSPALLDEAALSRARWALLDASDREDPRAFTDRLTAVEDALAAGEAPRWLAWSHAFTARRQLIEHDSTGAGHHVTAARAALEDAPADAERALLLAYLAHLEATGDRFEAALHLAVDASLLTDQVPADAPSRELHQAHHWLSLALTHLDLEELAVAQALRGHRVAAELDDDAARWQLLRLCAQQHAELAQTVHRRGDDVRAARLAAVALRCSFTATDAAAGCDYEPPDDEADLLAVVHGWALTLTGDVEDTLPALRRVRDRIAAEGSPWLRGYADLALSRLLSRIAGPPDALGAEADEAADLLYAAANAFAGAGDRRRYRQCLLELGQTTAALGRATEALRWLEAYRTETARAHHGSRELWAEMFVRRSRLREAERQNALMRRHALEDPLTGLGNRRSAERRLAELDPASSPVALAVVDIDRFKTVNDAHSHLHGDAVLRQLADLLRQHCRTGDEVYRWAGDEFVVVLPGAQEAQAVVAMERVRAAVVACDWPALGLRAAVTVSIGIAVSSPGAPRTWRQLFDDADLNLFAAKRAGRDTVATAADGGPAGSPAGPHTSVDDLVVELLGARSARTPGWAFEPEDADPGDEPAGADS
ncbi:diguanylate cyclase (GGDEF) domain-containing protein [Klenkia marina]|uniref:Diguanylate cyclase (GGDEF) domain-containing protein n=1 Tax=Klenkia marina TaxID=1960309 RepID=A0A1G4XI29_9ACTN|nr:GGDEF domain-containing protein [Klenkia marina]SCX40714.1 diguanylate cyclase (GGDEF) domain-containing protein [Klenkia marina]